MFTQLLFSSTFTASIFLEMKVLPSSSSRRFKTVFLYFLNAWERQLVAMEWITTITGLFIHYHLHFQCGLQSASSLPGNFGMYLFDIFAYFYQSTSVTEPKLHFSHVLFPTPCSPGGCKHLCSYVTAHDCKRRHEGEGSGCSQTGWPCKQKSSKHQELHARRSVCCWEFSSWLSSSYRLGIWYTKGSSTPMSLDLKKWPESSFAFPCCSFSSQRPVLVLMMLLQIGSENTSQ